MQKTSLDNGENAAKFPAGPTFEIPGPILFIVANTELNVVAKSILSIEISRTDPIKRAAYDIK